MFYFANPPFVGYFYALPSEGSYLVVNKNLVELGALVVILVSAAALRGPRLDRARPLHEETAPGSSLTAAPEPLPRRSLPAHPPAHPGRVLARQRTCSVQPPPHVSRRISTVP